MSETDAFHRYLRDRAASASPPGPTDGEPPRWLDPGPDPFGLDWAWEADPPADGPAARPPEPPVVPRSLGRRLRRAVPWAVAAAAILVAVLVWRFAGPRGGPTGELVATSTLSRQGVLGADTAFSLAVRSPADGFVTVVLLPPDGPPMAVYPGFGDADIPTANGLANVDSLTGKSGTRVLAFVTPTPATDTIRKATDSLKRVENLSPETATRVVTDTLTKARHPWVAVADPRTIP